MSRLLSVVVAALSVLVAGVGVSAQPAPPVVHRPEQGETRIANIRQLTFGGENAEAYFSRDGRQLVFQSTRDGRACDQQYTMSVDGSGLRRASTGQARTTCGYFTPSLTHVVYASTTLAGATARRSRTSPAATCGRSTPPTTSSGPAPTAPA